MNRQRSSSTLTRYARNPGSIILPRKNAGDDEKETKNDRKYSKIFCISLTVFSILAIVAILVVLLGLSFYCNVIRGPLKTSNKNLTYYASSYNEFINQSNVTINCTKDFIFSKEEQKCVYPCGKFHSCGETCLKIEQIIFAIMSICGIFMSLFNLIAWAFVGSLKSFAHIGIFIVTCITLLVVSVVAIPGLPGASIYFCDDKILRVDEVNTNFPWRLNIYGVLYDCSNILTLFWLFFSILNISMVIYFNIGRRTKIAVLTTEIFLSILPIIFVVIPFTAGSRYNYNHSHQTVMLNSPVLNYFLQFTPCILLIGAIYILAIGILAFLHIRKISITKFKESQLELSSLEKRVIFLSILTVVYLIYKFGTSIWLAFVSGQIKDDLDMHLICVTLLSRVTFQDTESNGTMLGNVMPGDWNLIECQKSFDHSFDQNDIYPGFLDVINHILSRSLWIPTFILTFPDGVINLVKKKFKKCCKSKQDVVIRNLANNNKTQCSN